jgi:uroporphyrinogen III methyltransferase/synthase
VVTGTLADIAAKVVEVGLTPPAVTVVGDVVSLQESLGWSTRGPLTGKTVLVTRAREQASSLSALLRSYGAAPIEFPAIGIEPAEDYLALDAALAALSSYDWACFTSVNAVAAVDRRLATIGREWQDFARLRIAAVGPATAQALAAHGLRIQFQPERYVTEALAAGLPEAGGSRVLLARADIADARLVVGLEARGARVDQFVAYRTVVGDDADGMLRKQLEGGAIDVVTFASSSTVRNLCQALGADAPALLGRCVVACIGPVTAGTAREYGIEPAIVAEEHTIPGLVEALFAYLAGRP